MAGPHASLRRCNAPTVLDPLTQIGQKQSRESKDRAYEKEGNVYVDKSVRQPPTVFPPFLFLLVQPLHHLFFYSPQASSSSFSLRDAHARELKRNCVGVYLCIFTRTLFQRAADGGAIPRGSALGFTRGRESRKRLLEATGIYDILGTRSRDLKRNGFKSLGRRKFLIPLSLVSYFLCLSTNIYNSRFYINIRVGGSIRAVLREKLMLPFTLLSFSFFLFASGRDTGPRVSKNYWLRIIE